MHSYPPVPTRLLALALLCAAYVAFGLDRVHRLLKRIAGVGDVP